MLNKNVYVLYPPGYSGSYINWCINISDSDRHSTTVKNPINDSSSLQFGGTGTAHLHTRIPTHQAYTQHVNWVLLNKPTEPQIYIINTAGQENNYVTSQLLQQDRTGIIINIHNNHDQLIDSYGAINSAIKWPVRYLAGAALSNKQLSYNPFDCVNDYTFRNWAVTNNWGQTPLYYNVIDSEIQKYINWYHVRHKYHPHEVNETTYISTINYTNRIFQLSCLDIASPRFLATFYDIMNQSQCSDKFDLTYVNDFHKNYIDAQQNLQWFKSVDLWKSTGELDDYLSSHSIIQARLIFYILKKSNINGWQSMGLEEINENYQPHG